MGQIQIGTFSDLVLCTRDRTNHAHGISIYTLGTDGTYKDGAIKLNGHTLVFKDGYVKYTG